MSFSDQISFCRNHKNLAIAPTEQEVRLSQLSRPGFEADRQIKQILHPGKYAYFPIDDRPLKSAGWNRPDVAIERAAIVREPKRVRITNVTWRQSQEFNWAAHLPISSGKIRVPVDMADDATLGYYNCRLLSPNDIVSLHHRSIITNFRYDDDYLKRYVIGVLGCSSIEQHEFAHIDRPLDKRSGYLLIGRMDPFDQSLELTAFFVRQYQSVYIPAKTIHTNDYLLGTWETLLSSYCEFPSAQIKQPENAPLQFVDSYHLTPFNFVD